MTRARYGEGAQVVCDDLVRIFKVADLEVVALQGLDLLVAPGEMMAVVGRLGERQVDAAEHPRRARLAVGRTGLVAGHDLGRDGPARAHPVPPSRGRA